MTTGNNVCPKMQYNKKRPHSYELGAALHIHERISIMDTEENEGFEDLTETNTDGAQVDPDGDSGDADEVAEGDAADDEAGDSNDPDPAMDTAALEAQITILQTENQLLNEEVEKWKSINLQLLMAQANDATVGAEDEDFDGDDPEPYSSVSGSDSLFETKES